MNKLSIAVKQLDDAIEVIYELEAMNETLLKACGMFVAWNNNEPTAPTFHKMESAIIKAFLIARGDL